jgi:hypothetical protein
VGTAPHIPDFLWSGKKHPCGTHQHISDSLKTPSLPGRGGVLKRPAPIGFPRALRPLAIQARPGL